MRMSLMLAAVVVTALSIPLLMASAFGVQNAQFSTEQRITPGSILVANEKLGDPNFVQTVILIVETDEDKGAMGLVVNKQTKFSISKVFPKNEHATKDPIYLGGPVGVEGVQALLRSPEKPNGATRLVSDIYVSGSKDVIERSIAAQTDPSKFRLYLGYAGWGPGQLEAELRIGAWSVIHGSSRIVFDQEPDTLWDRLTRESHMRMAGGFGKLFTVTAG